VEEQKVPELRGPKMTAGRVRRRMWDRRSCEIDLCTKPECLAAFPAIMAKALRASPPRRKRKAVFANPR
jgi:hypothetical protein